MKTKLEITKDRANYFRWLKKIDDIASQQADRVCTSKYIHPFQTERTTSARAKQLYEGRLRRSPCTVITPSLLEQHRGHLAQKIAIEGFSGEIQDQILDNTDGLGRPAQVKFSERLAKYLKDGQVACLVEGPNEVAESYLEAQQRGERSYQITYCARDILRVERFTQGPRKGQLKDVWLRELEQASEKKIYERVRRYYYPTADTDSGEQSISDTYAIQILQRETDKQTALKLKISQAETYEYDIIEELSPGLDDIPIVIIGEGAHDSVAYKTLDLDIAYLNTSSILRNINYYQCFRLAFIFGIAKREEISAIGENLIHTFSDEGNVQTIEPGNPEALERERDHLAMMIRRISFKQHNTSHSDATKQIQSAEARAKDLVALEAYYNDILDMFASQEERIYKIHQVIEGGNPEDVRVSIRRDYGLSDDEVKLSKAAFALNNAHLFNPGGDQLAREIMASLIEQLDLTVGEGESEKELKDRLKQAIRASAVGDRLIAPRSANAPEVVEQFERSRAELS